MLKYPNIDGIMDIAENELEAGAMNFEGMNVEQKLIKWNDNVMTSMQDRLVYIKEQQLENKRSRVSLLRACKDDEHTQKLVMAKCGLDPIFWIEMFAWTYNPRLQNPHLPFLLYPFQKETILDLISSIENGIDHWLDKSRDMGFSWMVLVIIVRGFLFKGWASLVGSYKEGYVDTQGDMDSAFERIRYIMDRIPRWMKPDDILSKYMSISSKKLSAEIAGDAGQAFGTGGRRKFVFLDEFALWQYDKTALRKTKDVTNCRIFGGTPEGIGNVYGKVMTNHKSYRGMMNKKTTLLWKLHPLKSKLRYELQKKTRTDLDLAKEVDISYETSVTGAVYPLFHKMATFGKFKYDASRKTYTSWDFGLDSNAVLIIQKDFRTGALYVIDSIRRVDWDIRDFGSMIMGKPFLENGFVYSEKDMEFMSRSQHYRYSGHFGDPYNIDSRTTANKKNTIRSHLLSLGIHMKTNRRSNLQERINTTKLIMNRLFIDEDQIDFITSITQSRYPEVKEGSQNTAEKNKPIHDENSHYRTSLEYFADNEPTNISSDIYAEAPDYSGIL